MKQTSAPPVFHELTWWIDNSLLISTPKTELPAERRQLPEGLQLEINTDLAFNASASIQSTHYPIYSFNYGLICAARDVAAALVCDPRFCPWIPFAGEEICGQATGPLGPFLVYESPSPNPLDHPFEFFRYLKLPQPHLLTPRTMFEGMIAWAIITFISFHEQAHYHWGHCYYYRHTLGLNGLKELDPLRAAQSENIDGIQTMNYFVEHQADSNAFQRLIIECSHKEVWVGRNPGDVANRSNMLMAAVVGVQATALIIDLKERVLAYRYQKEGVRPPAVRTHPHSQARLMHIYRLYLDSIYGGLAGIEAGTIEANKFFDTANVIAEVIGIPGLNEAMIADCHRDPESRACITPEGRELFEYRNERFDLLQLFRSSQAAQLEAGGYAPSYPNGHVEK